MSQSPVSRQACNDCGTAIAVEDAIKLIVKRGDEQVWTVLCPECAVVHCEHCGHETPIETAVRHDADIWERNVSTTTCAKCGHTIPLSKAAKLRQENDPSYSKTLCPECLGEVGVPPGFYVERDLGS